jgi:hypothetical protein
MLSFLTRRKKPSINVYSAEGGHLSVKTADPVRRLIWNAQSNELILVVDKSVIDDIRRVSLSLARIYLNQTSHTGNLKIRLTCEEELNDLQHVTAKRVAESIQKAQQGQADDARRSVIRLLEDIPTNHNINVISGVRAVGGITEAMDGQNPRLDARRFTERLQFHLRRVFPLAKTSAQDFIGALEAFALTPDKTGQPLTSGIPTNVANRHFIQILLDESMIDDMDKIILDVMMAKRPGDVVLFQIPNHPALEEKLQQRLESRNDFHMVVNVEAFQYASKRRITAHALAEEEQGVPLSVLIYPQGWTIDFAGLNEQNSLIMQARIFMLDKLLKISEVDRPIMEWMDRMVRLWESQA